MSLSKYYFLHFFNPQKDGKVPAKVTKMVVPSGKQTWLLKIAIYGWVTHQKVWPPIISYVSLPEGKWLAPLLWLPIVVIPLVLEYQSILVGNPKSWVFTTIGKTANQSTR